MGLIVITGIILIIVICLRLAQRRISNSHILDKVASWIIQHLAKR